MKTETVKDVVMALSVTLLLSTIFTVVSFGVYPGPDEVVVNAGSEADWVESTSKGWYNQENWNYYLNCGHKAERYAGGISQFKGNMKCHWQSSEYDIGEYEFDPGVNYYSGIGYNINATWIESWTYSKFTNFFGGVWSHQATAYTHAFPF